MHENAERRSTDADLEPALVSQPDAFWERISRRKLLRLGGLSALGLGMATVGNYWYSNRSLEEAAQLSQSLTALVGEPSLQQRAAAKGLLYGAASGQNLLQQDAGLSDRFRQECSVIVAENDLKWYALRPSPNEYNFEGGDWAINFARRNNQKFHGHTLVWQQSLPDWFEETVNASNAEKFMVEHINRVMRHYAGQIHSWDVVNEAINSRDSDRRDGLNQWSPWLRFLGKDYVDLAFRAAAVADPSALRVYNEGWMDYDTSRDRKQRGKILDFLAYLKSKGTPIQALGIQAHLWGGETNFDANVMREFLRDVASMGLQIMITELDVADANLPADTRERDRRVADAYEQYLMAVLDEPAVVSVVTWGLSDRHTWLNQFAERSDGLRVRSLPLDDQLNRKPAWGAIARAFDQAPPRTAVG